MSAKLIEGKPLAYKIKNEVKQQVAELEKQGILPCLAVILVGNDPASAVYVKGKEKDCQECGIRSKVYRLPEQTTEDEVLTLLSDLSKDTSVHGILVQLPLPEHIQSQKIIQAIPPEKDVDGFTFCSTGRMMLGEKSFLPCTPAGCIAMIESTGISIAGKNAVVLGRSNIVGKPAAILLLEKNATITICHSQTKDLTEKCRQADILLVAIGKAGFVTSDMVKPGAIVIDVGINRMENGKLQGDVDPTVMEKAAYLTPVPGGVGLMTRAMLMKNTVLAAERQNFCKR